MRKDLGFAEQVFTVVSLLLYSGALLTLILSGGVSEGEEAVPFDNSFVSILWRSIYLVTFLLLLLRWKNVIYILRKDRFTVLFVGLAVASVLWSEYPDTSMKSGISLVGTTMFGLYLATRYTMKQQVQLLGWVFGIAVVLSLIFAVALPKYGLMGGIHSGAFRGIYAHKNFFGKVMVLSAITFLILAIDTKKKSLLLWCGFGLSVILLILSRSSSSMGNIVILLFAFLALQTLRWQYERMIPALIALVTAGGSFNVWFKENGAALLGAIGKDPGLSGRTDMWPFVLDMIWQRPWLGYGYSGFWNGIEGPSAYVWYAAGWKVPHAHNGLLDLGLDFGMVGVSIFLFGFVTTLIRALAWVRLGRSSESFWPVIYLLGLVLVNVTESSLLINRNDIFWVLYAAIAFSVLIPPEKQIEVLSKYRKTNHLLNSNQ